MFERAGFGDIVALARRDAAPQALLAEVPAELVACVGMLGRPAEAAATLRRYRSAGIDTAVVVPSATDADPAGQTTLRCFAALG